MKRAIVIAVLLTSLLYAAPSSVERADRVVVLKARRELILHRNGKELKRYKIALGGNPIGPKLRRGDRKTPEGIYILDFRNARSSYYKSIHLSYPSEDDRKRARKAGVDPGGDIFIHGLPNGYGTIGAAHRLHDWTDGCIAVTNYEMDEIWVMVSNGTPIEIRP